MKTHNKLIINLFLSLLLAVSFTACQDPILYHIDQEVKLEEATILGDIFTILRFDVNGTEKLYIANGNIYSKDSSNTAHGAWVKHNAPEGHIHSLAADNTYLYAFVTNFDKDTGSGETEISYRKIFYSDDCGETWYEHPVSNLIHQRNIHIKVILMSTNAPQVSHRKAFIRINGTVYELNGKSYSTTKYSYPNNASSCAWFGSGVIFFDTFGACSNETTTTDATKVYFGEGYYLRYTTDGNATSTRITNAVRGRITALAVLDGAVLVSTQSGTALVDWNTGSEIEFTNLTSTVSTLYENHAVLAVYPEKPAKDNILYASNQVYGTGSNSAQFSHEGLWSYYPARGKWNIE